MFTVYSRQDCANCVKAKVLLELKNQEFEVKMEEEDFTLAELKELVPNVRSFPVVFNDGVLVGSLPQLTNLLKTV